MQCDGWILTDSLLPKIGGVVINQHKLVKLGFRNSKLVLCRTRSTWGQYIPMITMAMSFTPATQSTNNRNYKTV